jgi:hypothetical protein
VATDNRWSFSPEDRDKRPRLDIPLSRAEQWLRAASAAGVLVCIGLAVLGMLDLLLLTVSILAFAVIDILSGYPRYFNYLTPVTEENAEFEYGSARQLLAWLRVEIVGLILAVAGLLYIAKIGLPDYLVMNIAEVCHGELSYHSYIPT